MASPRDPARLRQGLNPLTTSSLAPYGARPGSPMLALSMASSHVQLQPAAHTPASAIQPYNPQEWVPSPAPMAGRPRQFMVEAGQAELTMDPSPASALPPPPYSPPRTRQQRPTSTAFEHTFALGSTPPPSSSSRMTMASLHRPSPEPQGSHAFPPPPPGARGNSRERRFGLPSLGRKKEQEPPSTRSPDAQAAALHMRRSIGPSTLHHEPERSIAPVPAGLLSIGPPAARRAASTGAIETPTSQRSRSTSQTRWEPGMPLPPPPPGPPPSSSRSQSLQSVDRASVPIISPPTRRPPPSGVASLGPVPPTPADWIEHAPESGQPSQAKRGRSPGLVIDTTTAANATDVAEPLGSSNSSGGLNRARAVRHDKTIVQRRTESKSRNTSHGSIDAVSQLHNISDIVVPSSSNGLMRRLTANKSTPRSAGRREAELPRTADSLTLDSRNSTPRAFAPAQLETAAAATPPFSPYQGKVLQTPASAPVVASNSLPTPPPQTRSASGSRARDSSRPPATAASTPVTKQMVVAQTGEQFAAATIDRFRDFAARESRAASDADRVRIFADFIVNESRIRRERYSSAIGAMGSEIFDLTRDLFRPMAVPASRRASGTSQEEWTTASTHLRDALRESASSASATRRGGDGGHSSSAPASANLPASPTGGPPLLSNINWANNYMPSLSPILSMSVSDNYENGSSRGRPPSRWWETDSQGEPRLFERSKRESKYMGLSKDQWFDEEQGGGPGAAAGAGAVAGAVAGSGCGPGANAAGFGELGSSSEYPLEKTGWHDQGGSSVGGTPQSSRQLSDGIPGGSSSSLSIHSRAEGLDVSRLVTLPPPYPRHHPAVNNNHPQLAAIRASVRSLNDLSELNRVKETFAMESSKRRDEFAHAASERKQALMTNLQKEISSGNIGYADAAIIESDSQDQEQAKKKELEKEEYDKFQNQVVLPLNDQLTGRITVATDLFDDLGRRLFDNGQIDADMPQEEGDDRPELLEKLTLLKWIFETRESLHRAIYDILSERNTRYCEVVMTPYRLSGNHEKLKSAEAFFAEDATKRQYAFANEVLDRARDFRSVLEEAVERGVALQLSAFWDIAPPLRRLLDSIPSHLGGFSIQIPGAEFDENPAYHDHPLQYLHSILTHTEKSTYQFIESHTNLLCLLHEVKEAVVHAKARVLETQLAEADGTPIPMEERSQRAQLMRRDEDRRLTEDLKEKVRVVQDQWNSALGEGIRTVKDRTREWLLSTGGWDETLEEGAVFSPV
ncbi:hypothetical protein E4U42_006703 [Claviceps africana]|uniref:Uncharacterized protein n=1 Tax=Claviceps africana TaxID=83212 RepID=A0A8K0J4W8_9HYPO|nr:hypothetical protein E4U42_006703 [Claviceps africana]